VHSFKSPTCCPHTLLAPALSNMASERGATNNERLLAAAKDDNGDLLEEVFDEPDTFDINYHDGLGNTALHYAVLHASHGVIEDILSHENCDVDPVNKLDKATPLHLAVATEDPDDRRVLVESLLEAGANLAIRNKYGQTAQDLVKPNDHLTLELFREAQAEANIGKEDIAYEDEDDVASDGSD